MSGCREAHWHERSQTGCVAMRLFIFARHAESVANVAHILNSDPAHPAALTTRGRAQARKLGAQVANLNIDLAFCTRFPRTHQTVDLALQGRGIPVLVEPRLDEVEAGVFDGAPIQAYWAWKEEHASNEPFPHGESLDAAVRRYVDALQRLLARRETVTLVVAHELALRYLTSAAAGALSSRSAHTNVANAAPHLFDEPAVRRATQCLETLAPPPMQETQAEAA